MENIPAYILEDDSSAELTPQQVVKLMVDILRPRTPGIFSDPTKTFSLTCSQQLDSSLWSSSADSTPPASDPHHGERLRHIPTSQIHEMRATTKTLHCITI